MMPIQIVKPSPSELLTSHMEYLGFFLQKKQKKKVTSRLQSYIYSC